MHSDFVSAATRGAMAVIDGNVMAINPGEEAKMQVTAFFLVFVLIFVLFPILMMWNGSSSIVPFFSILIHPLPYL